MKTMQKTRNEEAPHAARGPLDLKELRVHIRRLATIEETESPIVSCYVDLAHGLDYRPTLEARAEVLRKTLEPADRRSFELAFEGVMRLLGSDVMPANRGAAAFCRVGSKPFSLALQFQVSVPTWLSLDTTPHIGHLVELKDTYDRFIVMILAEEGVRILEISLGAVTREVWAERPELRQRVGRGWARERYQNRRRDRDGLVLKEELRCLEQLVAAGGHSHIVLAGTPRLTARIREALPRHLGAKLFDTVSVSPQSRTSDVVAATLESFVEQEERESHDLVKLLTRELRRNGLAVAGCRQSLEALLESRVDVLLVTTAFPPTTGWACAACEHVHGTDERPTACCRCGADLIRAVNLREEMIRLAERAGSQVECVRDGGALGELGGVGCLLRYLSGRRDAT